MRGSNRFIALYEAMNSYFVRWVVFVPLFLLVAAPAGSQTAKETETVFWQSVECESAGQVGAYLEVYPQGAYVAEAWACLEGQVGLDRAARILVQQGLAELEYTVGAADGLFGPSTRAALRQWQTGKGFTATGYLTQAQAETLMAQGRAAVVERREREEARRQAQEAAVRAAEKRRKAEVERQRQSAARREKEAACVGMVQDYVKLQVDFHDCLGKSLCSEKFGERWDEWHDSNEKDGAAGECAVSTYAKWHEANHPECDQKAGGLPAPDEMNFFNTWGFDRKLEAFHRCIGGRIPSLRSEALLCCQQDQATQHKSPGT